ncbi:helix-turn-helix domain-containing protein [Bacillus subtilis]|nr:helix-turn-helix transcriptional regulator [Bacillus subtilis]
MTTHEYFDFDQKQPLIFPEMLPLHKALRLKRVADGFTQTQLATMLGCGVSTINEVEKGKRRIPYKCLEKAKRYLYEEFYIDGVLQTKDEHY